MVEKVQAPASERAERAFIARGLAVPAYRAEATTYNNDEYSLYVMCDFVMADPPFNGSLLFLVHRALNSDDNKRQRLSYAQQGATRQASTKEMITSFEIVLPAASIMWQFGELTEIMFRQGENLALRSAKLRIARDLLLPRLMSGQIAV